MAKTKAAKGETIRIDPVTRIEGHLRIEALVDGGEVKDARCSGTLFRGFENILPGRHPLDAVRLTQRVCGVCPTAHATASAFALDEALGVADRIPANGRIVRNLIFGSNFLQSHILHFFALAALDYADVTAAADYDGPETDLKQVRAFIDRKSLSPFFPRYEGDYRCDKKTNLALVRAYVQALRIRRISHEMHSIFGGKMPHNVAIVPGGVTVDVTADKIASFFGKLQQIQAFIEDVYIPAIFTVAKAYGDYFDIGRGCGRFLSYGAFNLDGASADPLARKRLLPAGLVDADGKLAAVSAARIAED
ncbi:MAG: nickel-dependent hydrogenase large subunit, partial [Phycisphaerae bacterium]